jgi:hypothetical protein
MLIGLYINIRHAASTPLADRSRGLLISRGNFSKSDSSWRHQEQGFTKR